MGQLVPARISLSLFRADLSARDIFRHHRVILGDLGDPTSTQEVCAAVPHVGNRGVLAMQERSRERRAHAHLFGMIEAGSVDRLIRLAVGAFKRLRQIGFRQPGERIAQRRRSNLAGNITRRCATHAIGNQEEKIVGRGSSGCRECQRHRDVLVFRAPGRLALRRNRYSKRLRRRIATTGHNTHSDIILARSRDREPMVARPRNHSQRAHVLLMLDSPGSRAAGRRRPFDSHPTKSHYRIRCRRALLVDRLWQRA